LMKKAFPTLENEERWVCVHGCSTKRDSTSSEESFLFEKPRLR
jgi:hypothetical protein